MHATSKLEMAYLLRTHVGGLRAVTVLDIGSLDVNGTYRDIIPWGWQYIGLDVRAGPNVDMVTEVENVFPIDDDSVDVAISGQCLEHVANDIALVSEMYRVLQPGGLCLLTAPEAWPNHYPPDYRRYSPGQMRALLESVKFDVLDTYVSDVSKNNSKGTDCWGVAFK